MSNNNQQQDYEIGQIIYILNDKAEAIVPAIVVEEIVHKKLDGKSVSWKIAIGPLEKKKIISSTELSGEIFLTLDEVKESMTKKLLGFVNSLVGQAQRRTNAWYGEHIKKQNSDDKKSNQVDSNKIDPAALLTGLDDDVNESQHNNLKQETKKPQEASDFTGQTFKIKNDKPPGPLRTKNHHHSNNPKDEARQKLRELMTPDDDDAEESNSEEYILTDDGRRLPVKYNING